MICKLEEFSVLSVMSMCATVTVAFVHIYLERLLDPLRSSGTSKMDHAQLETHPFTISKNNVIIRKSLKSSLS